MLKTISKSNNKALQYGEDNFFPSLFNNNNTWSNATLRDSPLSLFFITDLSTSARVSIVRSQTETKLKRKYLEEKNAKTKEVTIFTLLLRKDSWIKKTDSYSSYSKILRSNTLTMSKGLQPSSVSRSKLPLPMDSNVFVRNNNSSALNSSPCATIVTSSGQEHKHAMARIVNCLLPEIAICTSSCSVSLAWKMAIWSSAGQFLTGYGFYKTCRSFSCDLCADHPYLIDRTSPQIP